MREGLLAEFDDPARLVDALRRMRDMGHVELDAYCPHPVEGLGDALGFERSVIARFTLSGGLLGALTGYGGQWWITAVDFPLNVGGRPLHSAPAFIPVTFELTILFAALATVLGLFIQARLGSLYAPVDDVAGFESASIDRFWIAVGADASSRRAAEDRLAELGPLRIVRFGGEP